MDPTTGQSNMRPVSQPIFNVPTVVLVLAATMIAIHEIRQWLPERSDQDVILGFAFIPLRYSNEGFARAVFGEDELSRWLTPITYGFLHADWQHVAINSLWLVVFGSAVAWRFGAGRFLLLAALSSAGGALAHYLAHSGDVVPVIGASAAISGMTAAATRFVFETGGPLSQLRLSGPSAFRRPALPLLQSLSNPRVLGFVAIWFVLTIVSGAGVLPNGLEEGSSIAWEAHLGGFFAGIFLFPLLDPVNNAVV